MEDFIDRAVQRDAQASDALMAQDQMRRDAVERLKLAFPEWRERLFSEVEAISKKLIATYPEDPNRSYSVNWQASGFLARCQGRGNSLEVEFVLPIQRMTVRHHDTYVRRIYISQNSDVGVEYTSSRATPFPPILWDPKLVAEALMSETTGL